MKFLLGFIGVLFISHSLLATPEGQENESAFLLFKMELEDFLERSNELRLNAHDLPRAKIEAEIESLIEISTRMASIYFQSIDTKDRPKIDRYLALQIQDHLDLRVYFVLIGNQFLFGAEELVSKQNDRNRRYRLTATIGGAALGALGGGAILYFKPNWVKGFWRSSLLVLGAGAAGAGIGYGATAAFGEFVLPAEPGIRTARDFVSRYPAGEDFISQIEILDPDLQMSLDEIDRYFAEGGQ